LIHHASADVGFMFAAYNLRRLISIIGFSGIKAYLRELTLCFSFIYKYLRHFKLEFNLQKSLVGIFNTIFNTALNQIYLTQIYFTNGGF
jgi:hypothetical protein